MPPSSSRVRYCSPSNPPRVRGNVRDAIRDDGVAAVGTGMCRLRRPARRWLWPEGTGEASGLAGVAFLLVTFLWPRKEKPLAQARRAGETLSRAQPSRPARRQPCHQQAPSHPQPFSHKGRREQRRSRKQAPLPPWEKEAKTTTGTDPPPQGRRGQRLSRG